MQDAQSYQTTSYPCNKMPTTLRIILAQLNFCVGDIAGNREKIITTALSARDEYHGDVVVFPELALCGYSPEDLLLRPDFQAQIDTAVAAIQQAVTGID